MGSRRERVDPHQGVVLLRALVDPQPGGWVGSTFQSQVYKLRARRRPALKGQGYLFPSPQATG